MRKVWLSTMSLNARVIRQMQKVGFRQEALLRKGAHVDGQWYDEPIYGLFADEWPGYAAMIARLGLTAKPSPQPD
jgi:RimJ/RimL family protein N-acetyltransferase